MTFFRRDARDQRVVNARIDPEFCKFFQNVRNTAISGVRDVLFNARRPIKTGISSTLTRTIYPSTAQGSLSLNSSRSSTKLRALTRHPSYTRS